MDVEKLVSLVIGKVDEGEKHLPLIYYSLVEPLNICNHININNNMFFNRSWLEGMVYPLAH